MTDDERITELDSWQASYVNPSEDSPVDIVRWLLADWRRLKDCERDAVRWRWLQKTDPMTLAMIAWRVREACEYGPGDTALAVDAAIAKEQADGKA